MTQLASTLKQNRDSAAQIRSAPLSGISATNVQDALAQLAAGGGTGTTPPSITPTSISVVNSPYTMQTTDYLILVDTSGGPVTINVQAASARVLREVTIKDSSGNAAANNISLVRNGADVIDGLTTYPINSDFGAVMLSPKTGGYAVT